MHFLMKIFIIKLIGKKRVKMYYSNCFQYQNYFLVSSAVAPQSRKKRPINNNFPPVEILMPTAMPINHSSSKNKPLPKINSDKYSNEIAEERIQMEKVILFLSIFTSTKR